MCNRLVKFGKLGFRPAGGRPTSSRPVITPECLSVTERWASTKANPAKDQSYALVDDPPRHCRPCAAADRRTFKDQTPPDRRATGLGTRPRPSLQEICFIPDDDYVALLEHRHPELVQQGQIVDSSGKVLGAHQGIHRFTIGQRRGLRVAMGEPFYVIGLDARSNTVILGPKEEVMHRRLVADGVNWLVEPPQSAFRASVKIRYNDRGNRRRCIRRGRRASGIRRTQHGHTPGQLRCLLFGRRSSATPSALAA